MGGEVPLSLRKPFFPLPRYCFTFFTEHEMKERREPERRRGKPAILFYAL